MAGVALNLTIGQNGIFSRVEIAANTWRNADTNEQHEMNKTLDLIDKYSEEKHQKEQLKMFITSDIHYDSQNNNSNEIMNKIDDMIKEASNEKNSLVINLGDCIVGNSNKEKSVSDLNAIVNKMKKNNDTSVFFARGNHDDNGWYSYEYGGTYQKDEIISDSEWNEIVKNDGNIVKDINNPNGNYFFYDDENSKIRIFILDTEDLPYYIDYKPIGRNELNRLNWNNGKYFIKDEGRYIEITEEQYNKMSSKPQLYLYSYRYSSYSSGHAIRNSQLNFVANNLFNMKEDWAALFIMHVPLDTSKIDGERFGIRDSLIRNHDILLAIINAYKNGTKCILNGDGGYMTDDIFLDKEGDFTYDINVDYSKRGKGEVIAFISGHTHWNNTSNNVGFVTSLSNGFRYISIGAGDFSKITIDRNNSTITVNREGNIVTPNNTIDQAEASGVLEGSVESGSIDSGNYTVKYEQFYPETNNLIDTNWKTTTEYTSGYNMSVNMSDYTVSLGDVNSNPNYETFLTAVPVKPYTTYSIGSINNQNKFVGTITGITRDGLRSGDLKLTENKDGSSSFSTGPRQYALVILCHKNYKNGLKLVEGNFS